MPAREPIDATDLTLAQAFEAVGWSFTHDGHHLGCVVRDETGADLGRMHCEKAWEALEARGLVVRLASPDTMTDEHLSAHLAVKR